MAGQESNRSSLMLLIAGLATISSAVRVCGHKGTDDVISLTYYLHDKLIPPNTTAVEIFAGENVGTQAFGKVIVFDSPLLETASNVSALVGNSGGQITFLRLPNDVILSFTARFNTHLYNGSISAQGRVSPSTASSWEVAITGGTGCFRGASGFGTARYIKNDPYDTVIQYVVKFKRDLAFSSAHE